MKKNLKKSLSLALSLAFVFLLSVSAFAADIGAERAKSVALKDAGYSLADVLGLYAEVDYDNGAKYYDVEFFVLNSDGNVLEYSYEVTAENGKIREKDLDREGRNPVNSSPAPKAEAAPESSSSSSDIGVEAAKAAAVKHFNLNPSDVDFLKARKERDDGVYVYDIEFVQGNDVKYSCEVLASNGKVVDADKDVSRTLFDKLELFFEVLFAKLLSR